MKKQNIAYNKIVGWIKRDEVKMTPFNLGQVTICPLKGPTCKIFHLPRFRYSKTKES